MLPIMDWAAVCLFLETESLAQAAFGHEHGCLPPGRPPLCGAPTSLPFSYLPSCWSLVVNEHAVVLGIDCGGTHTDAVVCEGRRLLASAKVVTDHDNLPGCIAQVLQETDQMLLQKVERITLGTTLLVNACVQGRLDRVGLSLSAGPGLAPDRFALGEDVCLVPGGLDHRGVEVTPLEPGVLRRQILSWQEEGVQAFACVGKFSPRNPGHEERMGEVVRDVCAQPALTLGHHLSGALNFPRRIASAYYNSASLRLHNAFVDAVTAVLARLGCTAPVFLLRADGGSIPLQRSRPYPVHSLLSGPAASVMGALALTDTLGSCSLLMDIGGTTTDLALFVEGSPVLDREGMTVQGRRTLVRALATRSIGIGGDSLISLQEDGCVCTGPQRVGPAMAFGGTQPTLLDALNVLNAEGSGIEPVDACAGQTDRSLAGLAALGSRSGNTAQELALAAWLDAALKISRATQDLVDEINARPVYTLRELLGHMDVRPQGILLVGGPVHCLHRRLQSFVQLPVEPLKRADVANAIGAALTRPSAQLEVYADTGRKTLLVPALDLEEALPRTATLDFVKDRALALLKGQLAGEGIADLPLEVAQADLFATLSESGAGARDMRVACQVVPGLVHGLEHGLEA